MLPENDDGKFEEYLRQFQPVPAGPLPVVHQMRSSLIGPGLAAAALVLVACGMALWRVGPPGDHMPLTSATTLSTGAKSLPGGSLSLGRVNLLLNEDPSRLDTALTEASRRLLPNVQRRNGSLWALAQD